MNNNVRTFGIFVMLFIGLISQTSLFSALTVDADYITIYPGEEDTLSLEVENNLDEDLKDVSVSLILGNVPFSSVGSSTKTEDIDEDGDESFSFKVRANSNIVPGDYSIPYEISYEREGNKTVEKGSFGIRVSAKTDLDYSVEYENNIVGKQGKISVEIINRGLGEIKAVSLSIEGDGFKVISKEKVFIGNIEAEDSDSVNYDVLFNSKNANVIAYIEYKDFDNNNKLETIKLPLVVYSEEEAKELGLIKENNLYYLILGVLILVVVWFFFRKVRKKKNTK